MNHNDFDMQLADQLRGRADGYEPGLVTFDRVKRDAGRIRRRRASAVGAALAVALIGGGGAVLATVGTGDSTQLPVAGTSVVPTFHQDDRGATEPRDPEQRLPQELVALDPDLLPRGERARLDWLQGGVLHASDGREIAVPDGFSNAYRYDDGWLLINWSGRKNGSTGLVVDAEGRKVAPAFDTDGVVAPSADGTKLLFVADDDLIVHDNTTGESTVVRSVAGENVEPVGVDDAGTVYYNLTDLNTGLSDGRIWRDDTETDPSPGAMEQLLDVNTQGFTTRMVQLDDYGSCSAVFDPDGAEQARTCDWMPNSFSPDGTRLTFGSSYGDGFGDLELAIVGKEWSQPLVERYNYGDETEAGKAVMQSAWEDDDHLLVVLSGYPRDSYEQAWWIVRLGVDGGAELASGPITAAEYDGITLVP